MPSDRTGPEQRMTIDRTIDERPGPVGLGLIVGMACAVIVATAAPGKAQDPSGSAASRSEAAKQLEARKDKLSETERRAQSLQVDLQQMKQEQAQINQRLIETGRLVQQSESRLSQIEARLGELDAQESLIRGSLAQRHNQMAKLFSAMQRMGRNPPPVIITQREDALQMVRSAMLLARAFPQLKTQADELAGRLNELIRVMSDIKQEGERLKGETARLSEARLRLSALMESKRQTFTDRQGELESLRKAAADISRNVADLGDLIGRLDKEVAAQTALGAYDRALQAAEATAAAQQAPVPAAPATPPPAQAAAPAAPAAGPKTETALRPSLPPAATDGNTKVAAVVPRPQGPSIALEPQSSPPVNHGRMAPATPFHRAKGQLPLPVAGRRLISFGEKNQLGRVTNGVVLETRAGAQVTSPCDGWIVYAGEFRSYGQVLIINAGGGYHVLLAGLSRIDVEVGRFVLAAEPVGTMSSNSKGKGQDAAPVLYVEFRNKDGQTIDPEPWWAESSRKVQG